MFGHYRFVHRFVFHQSCCHGSRSSTGGFPIPAKSGTAPTAATDRTAAPRATASGTSTATTDRSITGATAETPSATATESVRFVFLEVREMLAQMIQRFKKIWHGQGLVQLARLQADPVINYMQQTYLEAVRREQNLADWNTREM